MPYMPLRDTQETQEIHALLGGAYMAHIAFSKAQILRADWLSRRSDRHAPQSH